MNEKVYNISDAPIFIWKLFNIIPTYRFKKRSWAQMKDHYDKWFDVYSDLYAKYSLHMLLVNMYTCIRNGIY